ncbi:MAG TPA: TonB-dependent receptor [Steroidobacteraceae bacterium]|nr:TonB-dependent receptor [Steroidobacteraceae bacterium]
MKAILFVIAALACASPPVYSQELEEVVVTARKQQERLQDVPIAVSAFTSEELEERDMRDIFDISRFTPGFSFERVNRYGVQGGVSRPVIRGMSNILGEGNASVFVDGVLFSDSILSFPMDVVERVEVIKGPQAALFGRATFSGAINLVTKKGSNEPESQVSLRAAEYEDYEVSLLSRGPVVEDKLFYMGHARYYTSDGQYHNALDGGRIGGEKSVNVNGSLELRPNEVFSLILGAGYSEDDDDLAAIVLQDRFANNCYLDKPRQYYCGEVQELDTTFLDRSGLQGKDGLHRDSLRGSGTASFDFGGWGVVWQSGLFKTDIEYGYDSTYQAGTAIGPTTIPGATGPTAVRGPMDVIVVRSTLRNEVSARDEWSTEVRFESRGERRVDLMAGVFYYENRRTLEERHFATTAPTIFFGESRIDNAAVFGSIGVDITDRWNATAELRYAEETIGNFNATRTEPLIEQTFDAVSPRVTSSFRFTPNNMLYVNVAQGNKPGVINPDPRFPPEIRFANEETSWNYELGLKNTLLDGRMVANVAVYYIDWTDQQLTTTFFFPTGGTQSYLVNAGKSEVRGAELELQGNITENFSAGLTYSYVDTEIKELNDPEAIELFGNPSLAGKHLPGVPENTASIFGRLAFPIRDQLQAYVRADASYIDEKFDQVYNLASTGEQTLVNATIGFESDRWNVSLFAKNLTDDRTPSSLTRYVDQMNLNVAGAPNPNPAQRNVPVNPALPVSATNPLTTATERSFWYAMPQRRQFGINATFRF